MPLRLDLLLPRRAPRFSRRYRGKGKLQCFRLVPWRNIQASHSSFVRMTGMPFCLLYPQIVLQKSKVAALRILVKPENAKRSTIRLTSVALPKSPMSLA
jgi:hypothetical protein